MTPQGHRRLILTRHAKSAWDDPARSDHDRPLNARGQRAARELGDWLASRGYEPEEVLCSTSLRTRETWERVAAAVLEVRPQVRYEPELYQAAPETLLATLKSATAASVMVLAHNPGIADFARQLCAHPPLTPDFARYPTSATLVVDFQINSWADLKLGEGSVLDFFLPAGRG
ncbi:MAG: phosphoglycerate mutase [Alphaproteobacteria bacterium HGW-Alphaproteobacteria-4]|nr:MAG: phosphoglycerate mutase [Alphaproteobacteria bacterium HGW-Alphaproteobacteria-4]